ncbi:MAG: membrane-associated PAP2 superfamily phosphatase [Paraglaciecola sp.]|jgi:membrane-associated PAP2 superfamily phosphatase
MLASTRFHILFSMLLVMTFLQLSGGDEWLASQIYHIYGAWHWQQSWLLETVIHKGGRLLIIAIVLLMLLTTLVSYWRGWGNKTSRLSGVYLCIATLASIIAVSLLKRLTTLPCPWDLEKFGGDQAPVYLYDVFSSQLDIGHCFPSGHASGGFALFSFYFAARMLLPKYQVGNRLNLWFLPGLCLGLAFGLAQQLRGAHFISHDIASALVCWTVCALIYRLFFARRIQPAYMPAALPVHS